MVSVDMVLELLQEERRRYALYYLDNHETPIPVEELSREVAKMESESHSEEVAEERLSKFKINLEHNDLPKASEAEFIEYDTDESVVRLTDEPPTFEAIVDVAEVLEQP